MKKWTALMLARSGIIAALYTALTYVMLPVASGAIQFRLSEMLTILPLFYIEAVPGLLVGCLLSNLLSMMVGVTIWDVVFGSLITLIAAIGTYLTGRFFKNSAVRISLGGFFPVALNALFLPVIWILAGAGDLFYILEVGYLTLSQGVIIWGFGSALYFLFKRLIEKEKVPVLLPYQK